MKKKLILGGFTEKSNFYYYYYYYYYFFFWGEGEGVHKIQYIGGIAWKGGGLGEFAELRGGAGSWQKKRGMVFLEGWYPNAQYASLVLAMAEYYFLESLLSLTNHN